MQNFLIKKRKSDGLLFANTNLKSGYDIYEYTNSGFIQTSDGLVGTGVKGYTTFFETKVQSFLDRAVLKVRVKFNSESVFGLYRRGMFGTYAIVDLINNKLKLCEIWNGIDQPVVLIESSIAISINYNHRYDICLIKQGGIVKVCIKDVETGLYSDMSFNNGTITSLLDGPGMLWGVYGFSHWEGYVIAESINISYDAKIPLLYACYGDSITEGNSLVNIGNNYNDRWCYKLYTHLNNRVLISGQGGATSGDLLARLNFDNTPNVNAVVFIGANDTAYATWLSNITAIIAKLESVGSTPIICTILPRDDRQSFINQANAYILNTLSLNYDIWDFAQQLTVNGDRMTRINSLFLSDNVHPNVAGHEAMYQYVLAQL